MERLGLISQYTRTPLKNISLRNGRPDTGSCWWRWEAGKDERRRGISSLCSWNQCFRQSCFRFLSDDAEDHLLAVGRLPPLLCQQALITVAFCCISNNFIMLPPPLTLLHLVCNAALAICTCLDSNYGVVKAFSPVACKFLLSHTLKSTESHLNGVHVSLLFASVVVAINLFAMPYALHINK